MMLITIIYCSCRVLPFANESIEYLDLFINTLSFINPTPVIIGISTKQFFSGIS
ncbi:MAG: hypothetical protein OQK56_00420 [Ignavibacteriaceae bacterium]|nr:hypothetical protein [Ignavibacteriaceae bacterium]